MISQAIKQIPILSLILILLGCATESNERPSSWYGKWDTTWETAPESAEGFDIFTDFETDGAITFRENDVTVTINGFTGCIFGPDTLTHTQQWKVTHDSMLRFYTEPDTIGISYTILSMDEQTIKLQLLEDIFLTLHKTD
jgi:hypothetical protein